MAEGMAMWENEGDPERRTVEREFICVLEDALNDRQRATLRQLARHGWILRFVRHPPEQPPVAAVVDPDRGGYAVLEPDGSLNNNPGMQFRSGSGA